MQAPPKSSVMKQSPLHYTTYLGMVVSQMRRAPNANVDFIDAKVKFRTNGVMDWLNDDDNDRENDIRYAVLRARRLSKEKQIRHVRNLNLKIQKLYATQVKKDTKKKKKVEQAVDTLRKKSTVSPDDITGAFPYVSTEVQADIIKMITNPNSCAGRMLTHVWVLDDNKTEQRFLGKIVRMKYRSKTVLVVDYWEEHETEKECHSCDVKIKEFVADMITGELHLI